MTAALGLMGRIGLRVPGDIRYRHLAIRLVSTACKMALEGGPDEADPDFESEVVSAFGEAFNNIAVHGYRDLVAGSVQIEVDWDDERLTITVVDTGRTFDPSAVAPPDLDELPEGGMGLYIMHGCMDEVDYHPGPPNVLRLVKLRGGRGGMLPPAPPDGTDPETGGDRGSGVDVISPSTGPRSGALGASGPNPSTSRAPNVVSAPATWRTNAVGSRRK